GAEAIASQGGLVLRVDARTVASALERGLTTDELRARLMELAAPIDAATERAPVRGAAATRPRLAWVAVSAFLPVGDPALRERLMDAPELEGLLVETASRDGLLVRPGVPREELERALASLGVVLD